jgi:hypothetical protein
LELDLLARAGLARLWWNGSVVADQRGRVYPVAVALEVC